MKRLQKNCGKYCGQTIDIRDTLAKLQRAAERHGWTYECLLDSSAAMLCGMHRSGPAATKRVYLSSGIHGDEPAGPLALLRMLEEDRWPQRMDLWVCPCLNPTGFPLNQRENADGIDLNRDYRHLTSAEIRAHVDWLRRQPDFDLTLVLHEDWEANGFYLYELNPHGRKSFAETIIANVSRVCPIETAERVDNWPASGGIIRPNIHPQERPQWPESIFLISHKAPLSYTLEAPSDFPLETRVTTLVTAVRTALEMA